MPDRPTVGLAMIVRNESKTLPRLAKTLEGQIDYWTVVDTGSTDDTFEVAKQVFAYAPGRVVQDRWMGFGPSRNFAIEAAEPRTDWLLLLDADDSLHGTLDRAELDGVDILDILSHHGNLRYWLPRLVRSGSGFRYHGRTHEYLAAPDREGPWKRALSIYVEHHADGGTRHEKYQRDLDLLAKDWVDNPNDPRTAFYVARTHDDLGDWAHAIEWYRRRLSMSGWDQEDFYSRYRLGACLLAAGRAEEGCGELWRSWGERSWRAEPLVALAQYYRNQALWTLGWSVCELGFSHAGAKPGGLTGHPIDTLFVDADATEWRIAYEASIIGWYIGETERSRQLFTYLQGRDDLPPAYRQAVEGNRKFYEPSA